MATLKQQALLKMSETQKCYECGKNMDIKHFGLRPNKGTDSKPVHWKACRTCRNDEVADKSSIKKRKEKAKAVQENVERGMQYCKPCKKDKPLSDFDQKKNGGYYVDCKICRLKKIKKAPKSTD